MKVLHIKKGNELDAPGNTISPGAIYDMRGKRGSRGSGVSRNGEVKKHTLLWPHKPLGKHSRSHSRDDNRDGSRKMYKKTWLEARKTLEKSHGYTDECHTTIQR